MIPYFQLVPEQQCDVLAESQDQLGLPALFFGKRLLGMPGSRYVV